MKIQTLIATALVATFAWASNAQFNIQSNSSYETILVAPEKVYKVDGFDNNDQSQIVITGNYLTSCYQTGLHDFEVNSQEKRIYIRDKATHFDKMICSFALVPYQKVVDLGIISVPGDYSLHFQKDDLSHVVLGTFKVAKAKNLDIRDDSLYAPIRDIEVIRTRNYVTVRLVGTFNDNCITKGDLKVQVQEHNDAIVLLPQARQLNPGNCRPSKANLKFSYKVNLKRGNGKTTLIHVRSMNGRGLNKLVEL